MKVVINKCFGGFGLSTEAMKRAIAEGAAGVYVRDESKEASLLVRVRGLKDAGDGYQVGWIDSLLFKDGKVYGFHEHDTEFRSDPVLVRIVEEMGEAASGGLADLKVVEIPDGVGFEIGEYDGVESIHEVHRTWG